MLQKIQLKLLGLIYQMMTATFVTQHVLLSKNSQKTPGLKCLKMKMIHGLSLTACALARMGEAKDQELIIKKLGQIKCSTLSENQKLAALRSYQLAFTRLGKPNTEDRLATIKALDSSFPSENNFENRELSQILLYLNAPKAVTRSVQEMLTATELQKKILSDEILQRNDRYAQAKTH